MPEQTLSNLIGRTYDAALDPALWPDVLEDISDFVGGCGAGIYSKNSVDRTADIAYDFGVDGSFRQTYLDTYVRMDPTTVGFFFFDIGDIITIADIVPFDEFLDSRFYKEWVQPQGWIDMATSVLEKSAASYAVFSVFRHEDAGPSNERVRRRMELLVPHIRRATLIGNTIQLHKAEASSLADALDGLSSGLFLLDTNGRLVQANQSGRHLLSDGTLLRSSGGHLHASDPTANDMIQGALANHDDAGTPNQGTTVPISTPDGEHHVLHVLPLTSGTRHKIGFGHTATKAVFVSRAQIGSPQAPEIIARAYGLTPSELRVLLAVFDCNGVAEIADLLGIAEATAKTHLHRLFGKTGTKRQADLVKLVAGFVGPRG